MPVIRKISGIDHQPRDAKKEHQKHCGKKQNSAFSVAAFSRSPRDNFPSEYLNMKLSSHLRHACTLRSDWSQIKNAQHKFS
jgi:hypothetical protein